MGNVCKESALKRMEWLDKELANRQFVAGDRYSIADITALVAIDFWPPDQYPDLTRAKEPDPMASGGIIAPQREGVANSRGSVRSTQLSNRMASSTHCR